MTLQHYVRVLRKRYPIVILAIIASVAGALGVSLLQTPRYTASLKLFVRVDTGPSITDINQGGAFIQARVKSYADLVTSTPVLDGVYRRLGVTDLPLEKRPKISATPVADEIIIRITATDESPTRARDAANTVGEVFPQVVGELEKLSDGSPAPVLIKVAEPAGLPTLPTSPRVKLNVVLGFLFGCLLGASLALLIDGLDTSVKSPDDLADPTESAPVLGTIAFDSSASRTLLVTKEHPHAPSSEAFRQLRTNVQFVDIDRDLRSFVVTSALPNEGKSTVSANLAIVVAQGGQRVVLVEADLRRPTLSSALALEGAVGLTNVLIGQLSLDDVLLPWQDNLRFLPCGPIPPNPSELLGSQTMVDLVKELESVADVVIFDSPPLLPVTDAAVLARATNGAILVVRANKTSRDQVRRAVAALHTVNANIIGSALNFVRGGSTYGYKYRYESGEHPVLDWRSAAEAAENPPVAAHAAHVEPEAVVEETPLAMPDETTLTSGAIEALRSSSPRRWRRVDPDVPAESAPLDGTA